MNGYLLESSVWTEDRALVTELMADSMEVTWVFMEVFSASVQVTVEGTSEISLASAEMSAVGFCETLVDTETFGLKIVMEVLFNCLLTGRGLGEDLRAAGGGGPHPPARGAVGAGQAAHLLLGGGQARVVGGQGRGLGRQLGRVLGTRHDGRDRVVFVLSAHTEGLLTLAQLLGDGLGAVGGLAGLDGLRGLVELRPHPAPARVRHVGLGAADGLVEAGLDRGLEVAGEVLAHGDEGGVWLREVGGVARGVHAQLAVEQRLGEVLELHGAGVVVGAAAGHVGLVAAANVHQLEGDRGEGSLLAGLALSCAVLLRHPLVLFLEVSNNILPQLHVENCVFETC